MFEKITNFFRKAGVKMGVVESLNKITDHPKISVNESEYQRIAINKMYYSGEFPSVKFRNSYGVIQERDYVSLNTSKVAAEYMASLVFNEQCKINIDNDAIAEFIEGVFQHNDFEENFERYLESGFALGGFAMRPYVSDNNQIEIAWCHADTFYPLRSNTNNISEGAIVTTSARVEGKDTIYYTLFEFHEWINGEYTITNELYRSKQQTIVGDKVSLKMIYDDVEPVSTLEGATRTQFVYCKPAGMNNKNLTSPLGLSIVDNARTTMKQINDTYDQFHQEIVRGKRRIGIPEKMLRTSFDKNAKAPIKSFDDNEDVFFAVSGDPGSNPLEIKDLTSEIRSQQYIESINQFMKVFEMQTRFSPGTFSFDVRGGLKTATEVSADNSLTFRTRNSQVAMVDKAIKGLIVAILELAEAEGIFMPPTVTKEEDGKEITIAESYEIGIDFDDGIFSDKDAQMEYVGKALTNKIMSRVTAIMKVFDLPEEEALKELARIQAEQNGNDPEMQAKINEILNFGKEE
ncbi:phage portal protein [Carnobacterium maltaromaticum]|uniref:phage portal protein n=1 Tax=Carnobacterium maltaromaticum TaxID=2751 RepID=UPI0039BDA755